MKAVDITRRAEQSAIERFPVFTVEQADANYDMRMEHGYAFELGATWMKSIASQPAASEDKIDALIDYFETEVLFEDDSLEPFQRIQLAKGIKEWLQSINVQGDAQQEYNMARERQEGYIEGYNYAKGLKEGDKSHVNAGKNVTKEGNKP